MKKQAEGLPHSPVAMGVLFGLASLKQSSNPTSQIEICSTI